MSNKKIPVSDINPIEIENFKKSLSNESITLMPNDEGYEEALIRWADNAILKAGLIVKVFSLDDIILTINFAKKYACDFTVHNGGHSVSGFSSSNGGIVLDMRKRNKVQVDNEKKLVYVQSGAIWKDVNDATWEHGLAVVGATIDHVGVGGMTLSGGVGLLTPKHGYAIDNLLGATIVLADGSVKQLSDKSNEDLFWAIRGGGPNFGVVTDFIFKAHDQPNNVVSGSLIYPVEKLKEIIETTNDWLNNRKSDEDAILAICRIPPDFNTYISMFLFLNDPSHENFRKRFSSFYKLEPIMDFTRSSTYPEAMSSQNKGVKFGGRKSNTSGHVCKPLKLSTFQTIIDSYIEFYKKHPNGGGYGAILFEFHNNYNNDNVPNINESPYPHRKNNIYHVLITQIWKDENDDKDSLDWVKNISKFINQDYGFDNITSLGFHSPNLIIKNDNNNILNDYINPKDVFGDNLERLKEIKAKYDPTIFFDKSVVIRPKI